MLGGDAECYDGSEGGKCHRVVIVVVVVVVLWRQWDWNTHLGDARPLEAGIEHKHRTGDVLCLTIDNQLVTQRQTVEKRTNQPGEGINCGGEEAVFVVLRRDWRSLIGWEVEQCE